MKFFLLLLVILNLLAGNCQAKSNALTYVKSEGSKDNRNEYFIKLLALALDKTTNQNNLRILKPSASMQQGRAIHQLSQGQNVDIIWTVTSKTRERKLLPIRIPLLKGLLGHRVLIIKKEDKRKFSGVLNLEDLQQFTAGQWHDWPDVKILQANGIKVATASTYDGLFGMLQAARFDFFPRGINEAWQEVELQANPELTVEQHLLIYYPSPIYFFVNNKSIALAERIEKGLKLSIEDGSFDRLFYSHRAHKKMFTIGQLKQRQIITLKNPLLPILTPLSDEKLWYKVK